MIHTSYITAHGKNASVVSAAHSYSYFTASVLHPSAVGFIVYNVARCALLLKSIFCTRVCNGSVFIDRLPNACVHVLNYFRRYLLTISTFDDVSIGCVFLYKMHYGPFDSLKTNYLIL